jgi:group I intron endonuclease
MAGGKLHGRTIKRNHNVVKSKPAINMTGVYEIVCLPTNKRYIGSTTTSFKIRFAHHLHQLRNGKHHSRYLQRAWNKYGHSAFKFTPIIFCEKDKVLFYEQMLMDKFKPEFNLSPTAGNNVGVAREINTGVKHEVRGELLTARQIAEKYGFNQGTIQFRIGKGFQNEDLIAPLWDPHKKSLKKWRDNNPDLVAKRIDKMRDTKLFKYEIRGELLNRYEIAEKYGLKIWTINRRLERGARGEDLIAPLHPAKGKRSSWCSEHLRRKNAKRYLVRGESLTIHELSEKYGLDKKLLFDRTKRGVSGDALIRPKQVLS